MSDTVDALVLDLLEWIGPRSGRPLRSMVSSPANLYRKAAPALPFPPPGQSTCAGIAALFPTYLCDDLPSNYPSARGIGACDARVAVAVTASETAKIDLGRFGYFGLGATPDQAREIERLGYGTIWVGGSPPAELSFVEPLLESTTAIKVATGIVNIWTAAAKPVAESFHRINTAYPGRFVLGVGVGHPEAHAQYRKPYEALVSYLDELDEYGVPAHQRVLAALGPRVLKLSAERAAGAHPANATPEHAAQARAIIGPNALLAPVHNVVLSSDAEKARAIGRAALAPYFSLSNYVSSWKRLGFTDADTTPPGSDKLIDAVIAHGTPDNIAKRLDEYLTAGANHVAILVHGGPEKVLPTLSELAGPLGLSR